MCEPSTIEEQSSEQIDEYKSSSMVRLKLVVTTQSSFQPQMTACGGAGVKV